MGRSQPDRGRADPALTVKAHRALADRSAHGRRLGARRTGGHDPPGPLAAGFGRDGRFRRHSRTLHTAYGQLSAKARRYGASCQAASRRPAGRSRPRRSQPEAATATTPNRRSYPRGPQRRGSCASIRVSTVVSAAFTVTFIAARTAPVPSRNGTAIDRMPGASTSSASAQPLARTIISSLATSSGSRGKKGGRPARLSSAMTAATWPGSDPSSLRHRGGLLGAGDKVLEVGQGQVPQPESPRRVRRLDLVARRPR